MATSAFRDLMLTRLVPEFCDHPSRGWGSAGFKADWDKISEVDAADFIRAIDAGIVEHVGRGQYVAPQSCAKEQFFSSGLKALSPRPFTIWAEPIITAAVLARLHFVHGWPRHLLGMQSKLWEFDFLAVDREAATSEYIAGEVKKTTRELTNMIEIMLSYGANPSLVPTDKRELNAYKKVVGLRLRKAPIFWAVGSEAINFVFAMTYASNGSMQFEEVSEAALSYDRRTSVLPT